MWQIWSMGSTSNMGKEKEIIATTLKVKTAITIFMINMITFVTNMIILIIITTMTNVKKSPILQTAVTKLKRKRFQMGRATTSQVNNYKCKYISCKRIQIHTSHIYKYKYIHRLLKQITTQIHHTLKQLCRYLAYAFPHWNHPKASITGSDTDRCEESVDGETQVCIQHDTWYMIKDTW